MWRSVIMLSVECMRCHTTIIFLWWPPPKVGQVSHPSSSATTFHFSFLYIFSLLLTFFIIVFVKNRSRHHSASSRQCSCLNVVSPLWSDQVPHPHTFWVAWSPRVIAFLSTSTCPLFLPNTHTSAEVSPVCLSIFLFSLSHFSANCCFAFSSLPSFTSLLIYYLLLLWLLRLATKHALPTYRHTPTNTRGRTQFETHLFFTVHTATLFTSKVGRKA